MRHLWLRENDPKMVESPAQRSLSEQKDNMEEELRSEMASVATL